MASSTPSMPFTHRLTSITTLSTSTAAMKLIYTTNRIENFNLSPRKTTRAKAAYPSDKVLLKALYLAIQDITVKWVRITGWHEKHRFTLHAPQALFTLHPSHFTLHASRFTLHASHFTLHASRFTLQVSASCAILTAFATSIKMRFLN